MTESTKAIRAKSFRLYPRCCDTCKYITKFTDGSARCEVVKNNNNFEVNSNCYCDLWLNR